LEKNYSEEIAASDEETIKLAVKALMEVVESGGKNIEVAILKNNQPLKILEEREVSAIVKTIEEEKQKLDEQKTKQTQ